MRFSLVCEWEWSPGGSGRVCVGGEGGSCCSIMRALPACVHWGTVIWRGCMKPSVTAACLLWLGVCAQAEDTGTAVLLQSSALACRPAHTYSRAARRAVWAGAGPGQALCDLAPWLTSVGCNAHAHAFWSCDFARVVLCVPGPRVPCMVACWHCFVCVHSSALCCCCRARCRQSTVPPVLSLGG